MNSIDRLLYIVQREFTDIFTYNCASCGGPSRGKCLCPKCMKNLIPAEKDEHFAYYYDGPARDAMIYFKFTCDDGFYYDTFCDWLLEAYSRFESKAFDAVVPVPSFEDPDNTVHELARRFSLMAKINFEPQLLKKIRPTKKQHHLDLEERCTNLKNAFSADPSIKDKSILLIDDIITSGSTLEECSKVLMAAGAKNVTVLTVLKTDLYRIKE